jgi:hypothetical protein
MDTQKIYPWEQRDDEPDNVYRAFKVGWRDQKLDRTLIEAARRYTGKPNLMKTPENLSRWSKEYEWASRARQWDRHIQRRKDEALVVSQEEAVRERAVSMGEVEAEHIRLGYNYTIAVPWNLARTVHQFNHYDRRCR